MSDTSRQDEIDAMATAYTAIASQPQEAWPRMLEWLNARLTADMNARVGAVRSSDT